MHLMYYTDEAGKRVNTLKKDHLLLLLTLLDSLLMINFPEKD